MTPRVSLALLAVLGTPLAQAGCIVQSGPQTAALVELYTSDGCGTCRPADRWLSGLETRFPAGRVVPLALHVEYRDYLASQDPYAGRRFSARERRLSVLQRMALVYTPQVILQGRDFRPWAGGEFEDAVNRINAQPARARIKVEIRPSKAGELTAAVRAEILDPAQRSDAVLYMAASRSRLQSEARFGEIAQRGLAHDYVLLEWQGPFFPQSDGRLMQERRLARLPGATPDATGVAAFVQNRRTNEVLQAVLLPACSP